MCKLGIHSVNYSFLLSNTFSLLLSSFFLINFLVFSLFCCSHFPSSMERSARILSFEFADDEVEVLVKGCSRLEVTDLALIDLGTRSWTCFLLFLVNVSSRHIWLASHIVAVVPWFGVHSAHEEVFLIFQKVKITNLSWRVLNWDLERRLLLVGSYRIRNSWTAHEFLFVDLEDGIKSLLA